MEPDVKRPRLTEPGNHPETATDVFIEKLEIKSILANEYCESIKTAKVCVGTFNDKKDLSKIMRDLSKHLPLSNLQHLKRVKENNIIICPLDDIIKFVEDEISVLRGNSDVQSILGRHKIEYLKTLFDAEGNADNSVLTNVVQSYLSKKGIEMEILITLCKREIFIEKVASRTPKLRWQYEEMTKLWPCKFHPNKYLESLYNNTNFTEEELNFHKKIVSIINFLSDRNEEQGQEFGICVDPRFNRIVAIASSSLKEENTDSDQNYHHPLQHCAMILIDIVARTQNGGAWTIKSISANDKNLEESLSNCSPSEENEFNKNNENELNFSGIPKKYAELIKSHFDDIKFGAQKVINEATTAAAVASTESKSFRRNNQNILEETRKEHFLSSHQTRKEDEKQDSHKQQQRSEEDNLSKYGPYLCTGYDIYLSHEPCLMCSMALVHSRVRKVFYMNSNENCGALGTKIKLHTKKELNHRFEVFYCFSETWLKNKTRSA